MPASIVYRSESAALVRGDCLADDESEWSEWSDCHVRDYYTQEPTPFFGVAPCKIVEREIR